MWNSVPTGIPVTKSGAGEVAWIEGDTHHRINIRQVEIGAIVPPTVEVHGYLGEVAVPPVLLVT